MPCQDFTNRSDIRGGSTLGSISGTVVPISTADIGLPQLAMHSACETAGSRDAEHLVTLTAAFYRQRKAAEKGGRAHCGKRGKTPVFFQKGSSDELTAVCLDYAASGLL